MVLVPIGPDSADKVVAHATRTGCAYDFDGRAWGISVFAASDDIGPASLDGLLVGR